jgi:hypothetical protein
MWRVLIDREYGPLVVVHVFLSILAKIHLHANKHQHLWNLLELSPSTMLEFLLGCFYAGLLMVKVVLEDRQQLPPHISRNYNAYDDYENDHVMIGL